MSKLTTKNVDENFNIFSFIIIAQAFLVPIFVLPNHLENAFFSPKSLLIFSGVFLMVAIYFTGLLTGNRVFKSNISTPKWLIILIFLNFFSLIYTENYYYTKVAVILNISCLLLFYFVSLYIHGKKALWLMICIVCSGILVSLITYLQFSGHFILFKWARPGTMVMGTIGNSNYLGAYLLFPLFAVAGIFFVSKGKFRILPALLFIFVFGAFLCTRARAAWLGVGISFPVFLILIKDIYRFSMGKYIRANIGKVATYGILIIVGLILLYAIAPQRFHSTMDIKDWTKTRTLGLRMKHWQGSIWLFKQSPLFGTGLWSYRNLVYDAQAEIHKKDPDFFKDYVDPKPRRAHNDYLEILNDGGLVAASFLLILFLLVMNHGWRVIKNKDIQEEQRIIAATAFSAMIGIMVAAFFFFPFRVNSTLFMTVLMMGMMEGLYLKNHNLLSKTEAKKFPLSHFVCVLFYLILIAIFSFGIYKPFRGELEALKYKRAISKKNVKEAEDIILKALTYNPTNSTYCLYASQLYTGPLKDNAKASNYIEKVIINFNGDLTLWSVHFHKGLIKYRLGSILEAREAFKESLYYYPLFKPSQEKLKEIEEIIKKHDRVVIKLR